MFHSYQKEGSAVGDVFHSYQTKAVLLEMCFTAIRRRQCCWRCVSQL